MNSNNILNYLSMVSNKNLIVNIMMHLAVIVPIVSVYLLKDAKVKKYIFNGTVLALFLSVTVNAAIYGNPFHAVTFSILSAAAGLELIRGKNQVSVPENWLNTIVSFLFIFMGLWYPEFVNVSIFGSLLLSPVGIIPCPTLLTALGMLNLYYPNVNKSQFAATVFFGLVYGIIGTLIFKVHLDLSLIAVVIYSVCRMVINRKIIKERTALNRI